MLSPNRTWALNAHVWILADRPGRTRVDASRPPKSHPRGSKPTAQSAPAWIQTAQTATVGIQAGRRNRTRVESGRPFKPHPRGSRQTAHVNPGRPPTPHLSGSRPNDRPQSCFFIVIPSLQGTRGDTREDTRGHSRENNMWTSDGSERGARKEQLMGQQGDKGGCAAGPQRPPTPSNAKPKPHLSSNRACVDPG